MGIVSVFAVVCGLAGLIVLAVKLNRMRQEQDDAEIDFTIKLVIGALLVMFAAGTLGIVNNYFVKIETPLDAPAADLPEEPEAKDPIDVPEIKPAQKPDPMKEAKGEHRDALDEFERDNSRRPQLEEEGKL